MTRQISLIIFNMGDNCQVNSNIYTFSTGGISNGLIGCGQPPSQPFVVGNQSMGSAVVCGVSIIGLVFQVT